MTSADEVFAPGCFRTEVGKAVPVKDEDGTITGEATVLDEDGMLEIQIWETDGGVPQRRYGGFSTGNGV